MTRTHSSMFKPPRILQALALALVFLFSCTVTADILHFPQRDQAEAAVIEWGHSALISGLDAVVAEFGPQTTDAALLEVETTPILALPITGDRLQNADAIHGNAAIVTDEVYNGYELAKMFQSHGAAAVLVVHVSEDQPDAIQRIVKPNDMYDVDIDIPVVSISWTAAMVLTTALLSEEERGTVSTLSAAGLPELIRLYAGKDRPFFEDIEAANPTIYLIHNLLTDDECDALLKVQLRPITATDALQYTDDISYLQGTSETHRAVQWQGLLQLHGQKAIEERIDQVTGFPAIHLSDFIVDRIDSGHWTRHYDSLLKSYVPLASITVFLQDGHGVWKFPNTKRTDEIQISARRGMAIVHHNTDDTQRFDAYAIHELDTNGEPMYVARKLVLPVPPSLGRRIVLPAIAMLHGGYLPAFISNAHEWLVEQYGADDGPRYFDMGLLVIPGVVVLAMVQVVMFFLSRRNPTVPPNGAIKTKKA